MTVTLDRLDALLERRLEASERYFAAEAGRLAELCRIMAERFECGGRLLAVGGSPQAWSDAHHVAVEFVHPVIVGKRALPALAVAPGAVELLRRDDDMTISFEPLTVAAGEEWLLEPADADPFVRQELAETAYHCLWELVHVFFEHLGSSTAGAGASGFLYPFLSAATGDVDAVVEDVRASVEAKAAETAELRRETIVASREELVEGAATIRRAFDAGGTLFAFGNGGSATDAMDVVADFRAAPQAGARHWSSRRALDLTEDSAILSALANDIGPAALYSRQLIAFARPGDVALALSTSGGSANIVEALAQARRRGLATVAFVGYDGGRIAAERLADHIIVTPSEYVPRIQEAQASAYHVLRELVE
ncbi:MAG: SIS domain-containing protein [Gaiellaceae bacterium MAG52_C11]|nr:SIS domain-containing protein [Candidatus Gaiellasilicea maunaloa]